MHSEAVAEDQAETERYAGFEEQEVEVSRPAAVFFVSGLVLSLVRQTVRWCRGSSGR